MKIKTIAAILVTGLVLAGSVVLPQKIFSQTSATLLFSDDFNSLSSTKWTNCYPGNRCDHDDNHELQCYDSSNAGTKDGLLYLGAYKETKVCDNGKTYDYTAALIQTQGKFSFKYGYAEARIRTVKGQGFWPAFWLLPEDKTWPPEIDIMEQKGQQPNRNRMTYVYNMWDGAPPTFNQQIYDGADFTAGYHTYGVDWQPGVLKWYVDGTLRASIYNVEMVPNKPMYVILNLAVGGDFVRSPDATTPFPSSIKVDYVKVWSQKP